MKSIKAILFSLAILSGGTAVAATISAEQALQRALSNPSVRSLGVNAPYALTRTYEANSEPTLYVLTNTMGQSLLLSADTEAVPVLGYFTGEASTLPVPVQAWLAEYSSQIAMAREAGMAIGKAVAVNAHDIAPIVQATWNQDTPFNNLTPRYVNASSGIDRQCPSGCVATAVAQVVHHYRYPTQGIGEYSYTWHVDQSTLSFDFANTTFNYDDMLTHYYPGRYTDEQANAVATLLSACGIAVEAVYNYDATGAMSENIAPGLINHFGYSRGCRLLKRRHFTLQQWVDILYAELEAGRPVCYAGGNNEGAHQFVVDGYDSDGGYFHINWGWGGTSDGYFLITGLDPANQGIGGSVGGFNLDQSAVIGIQPPTSDNEPAPDPMVCLDFDWGPEPQTLTRNATQTRMLVFSPNASPDGGWQNYCSEDMSLIPGVKFTNAAGDTYYEWSIMGSIDFTVGNYFTSRLILYVDLKPSSAHITVPNGTYKCTPVVKTEPTDGSEPQIFDAHVAQGFRQYVNVTLSDTQMVISNPSTASVTPASGSDFRALTPLYSQQKAMFEATIKAGSNDFYGYANLQLVKYMDDSNVTTLGKTFMSVAAGETAQFTWSGTLAVDPGTYYAKIIDDNGNYITGSGLNTITVSEVPAEATEINIDNVTIENIVSGSGSQYDPWVVDTDRMQIHLTFDLNCTAGYFTNTLFCNVMDGMSVLKLTRAPQSYLEAGHTDPIDMIIDMPTAEWDHTYLIRFKQRKQSTSGYVYDVDVDCKTTYFRLSDLSYLGLDGINADQDGALTYNRLTRTITAEAECERIDVVSLQGITVGSVQGATFDCSGLPRGVYIVVTHTPDGPRAHTMRLD